MKGIQYALERISDGERSMILHLSRMREKHAEEPEIVHVVTDLAAWSRQHRSELEAAEERDDSAAEHPPRPVSADNAMDDPSGNPGLTLLADLQLLFLLGSENSLAWEMLAQIAQAAHERDLLALAGSCHPQTLRQIRWANNSIKTRTPQILSSL